MGVFSNKKTIQNWKRNNYFFKWARIGILPIVSATDKNQGIAYYGNVSAKYINCLTASFNGVGTGYISYHDYLFNANTDYGILIPKFNEFNTYIALFITTVMNQFKYKYSYGRKLSQERLAEEYIKLPIVCDENGNPIIDKNKHLSELGYITDWKYMEKYKEEINEKIFLNLQWMPLEGKKASRIKLVSNLDVDTNSESWEEAFEWMSNNVELFKNTFKKYLK